MKPSVVYTAMLMQQAVSTMSGLMVPVLAPSIAADTGVSPSLIGLYTAFLYTSSMFAALAGSSFLIFFGGTQSKPSLSFSCSSRLTYKHIGRLVSFCHRRSGYWHWRGPVYPS